MPRLAPELRPKKLGPLGSVTKDLGFDLIAVSADFAEYFQCQVDRLDLSDSIICDTGLPVLDELPNRFLFGFSKDASDKFLIYVLRGRKFERSPLITRDKIEKERMLSSLGYPAYVSKRNIESVCAFWAQAGILIQISKGENP